MFEVVSFTLFSTRYINKEDQIKNDQIISDLQLCMAQLKLTDEDPISLIFGDKNQTSFARIFWDDEIFFLCKPWLGRGDKSRVPKKLISNTEWEQLDHRKKAIYLVAFLETGMEFSRRLGRVSDLETLVDCVNREGFQKILETLSLARIEAAYPIPWSIALVVGKHCIKYRK